MKLIIFGSTGGTGRHLVAQALEKGHDVTAFARKPEKIKADHPGVKVVKGDVLDRALVEQAITGQDAVLCALGTPLTNNKKLRAKGTKNIINAMEKKEVSRLICLSGLGCGDSRELLPFHYKYIIFPTMLRYVYADHEIQESHVRSSTLDWTIVRPASLTSGKYTGSYWDGFVVSDKSLTIKISRADVADFMLKQVMGSEYLHKAPSISY
ncbi:MAG: SDR family oxidoreductase [Gammaproteobacteria bacterium]|nr:SDR family oxidoreductase [Gammaproteobacteria bacterium]